MGDLVKKCNDKQRRLGAEGSMSEVGIPPPHNLDTPYALVAGYITLTIGKIFIIEVIILRQ